ncbi:hybrid sensor histidine kinase/response regulator [Arabiibacter massiliensis]|uniref:hybrid sensor histidine kinase/response regulator n=1 Tax=Arabiibacter massiliensis TaxID=1870985 RepID=UPI0009B99B37|nr:ATP-binding protein [Arabiibacter massiliensis]
MTMHSARGREGLISRLLNSNVAFPAAVAVIAGLLVAFYAMLMVNMGSIDEKTEDLKEHPFTVTVAAGRAETLLMQVKTLDDRLAFTHSPKTVESVKEEFDLIDGEVRERLDTIVERHRGSSEKPKELSERYEEFRLKQQELVALAEGGASDEEVARFLVDVIDPRIDAMYEDNLAIIENASRSFDQLYNTVAVTRTDTIVTATVLMLAVIASFFLFVIIIRRKNRQQEQLQESLRQALVAAQEANEAKSRFLSNVSHDIRTPLTAVIGLTDIAIEHADEPGRVGESLAKIKLSSHHLLNLVNDVLDMSKIESGQIDLSRAPFDLTNLVEMLVSIVRPQADVKRIGFAVSCCDVGKSMVVGDEMRVNQILINLLGNAVKYTEPGGKVGFSIRELSDGEVERARAEGLGDPRGAAGDGPRGRLRAVRFVVEDNGIGMSEEFLERIFEPFEREDAPTRFTVEGTGLGMSIAKSLVERMGGSIEVESARGRGSRFTIVLPFEDYADAPCEARAPEPARPVCRCAPAGAREGAWAHARVLLAEDDEIVGEIAEEFIKGTGAAVDRAWNGADALDLIRRAPEGCYDLVFMDVQMPRMDGLAAARAIVEECARAGRSRPPIIAMTANAYVEDRERAFEAGMDGYAVKPIGRDEIFRLFEEYVPLSEEEPCAERELSLV